MKTIILSSNFANKKRKKKLNRNLQNKIKKKSVEVLLTKSSENTFNRYFTFIVCGALRNATNSFFTISLSFFMNFVIENIQFLCVLAAAALCAQNMSINSSTVRGSFNDDD